MKKDESKKSNQPLEGEGNYSAARRYNKHLGDAIESGDLEAGAEEARRAIEGEQGAELERAAQGAKRGPQHGIASVVTSKANARSANNEPAAARSSSRRFASV